MQRPTSYLPGRLASKNSTSPSPFLSRLLSLTLALSLSLSLSPRYAWYKLDDKGATTMVQPVIDQLTFDATTGQLIFQVGTCRGGRATKALFPHSILKWISMVTTSTYIINEHAFHFGQAQNENTILLTLTNFPLF